MRFVAGYGHVYVHRYMQACIYIYVYNIHSYAEYFCICLYSGKIDQTAVYWLWWWGHPEHKKTSKAGIVIRVLGWRRNSESHWEVIYKLQLIWLWLYQFVLQPLPITRPNSQLLTRYACRNGMEPQFQRWGPSILGVTPSSNPIYSYRRSPMHKGYDLPIQDCYFPYFVKLPESILYCHISDFCR